MVTRVSGHENGFISVGMVTRIGRRKRHICRYGNKEVNRTRKVALIMWVGNKESIGQGKFFKFCGCGY